MLKRENPTTPEQLEGELEFDKSLRPSNFDSFPGQKKLKENLKIFINTVENDDHRNPHQVDVLPTPNILGGFLSLKIKEKEPGFFVIAHVGSFFFMGNFRFNLLLSL